MQSNLQISENYFGHAARDVHKVMKQRGGALPLNANTFSASLVPDYLQGEALSAFQATFAPLRACLQLWDPNPYAPKTQNQIKYVEAGSATLTDPANLEVGGSHLGAVAVSVSHYSQPWPLSNTDVNSGIRQRDLFFANAQALAATLMSKITVLLTTTNFPLPPIVAAPATFGMSDAGTAFGQIKGPFKSLWLDSPYFGVMSHASPRGFMSGEPVHGWAGVHEQSAAWASAGPKVRGVALAKPAIAIVTGYLEETRVSIVERTLLGLPGMDLSVEFSRWFNAGTRSTWCSLDVIFGAGKADANGAVLIQEP